MSIPKDLEMFMEALIKQMPRNVSEDQIEKFDADFSSPDGMPNRRPFSSLTGYPRFHAAGLSYIGARSAVQTLGATRAKIAALRSVRMSDRLENARLSSWHYKYVLRERFRSLLDLFKEAVDAPIVGLVKVGASYKKKTDRLLQSRHRGVHEYDHHDPLIRQVEVHELLWLQPLPEGPLKAARDAARRDAERRAKHDVLTRLKSEEEMFVGVTDQAFSSAIGLRDAWSFQP
jgi:hypothetical protein